MAPAPAPLADPDRAGPGGLLRNTANAFFSLLDDLLAAPRLSATHILDALGKDLRYMYVALLVLVLVFASDFLASL